MGAAVLQGTGAAAWVLISGRGSSREGRGLNAARIDDPPQESPIH